MSDRERVHEALVHAEQISQRGDSHYSAALRGGLQFLGWDVDRYLAADTHDLILALAAGLGGEKLTADDFWQRPESSSVEVEVGDVASFDVDGFMRKLAGG